VSRRVLLEPPPEGAERRPGIERSRGALPRPGLARGPAIPIEEEAIEAGAAVAEEFEHREDEPFLLAGADATQPEPREQHAVEGLETPEGRATVLEAARALEHVPELLRLSPHLLATARRPG
jgi:hypothetical protein